MMSCVCFQGLVLGLAHVEAAAADVAQVHIARTHGDLAGQVAVGGAVVAAATALVKHQVLPTLGLQQGQQLQRGGRGHHPWG